MPRRGVIAADNCRNCVFVCYYIGNIDCKLKCEKRVSFGMNKSFRNKFGDFHNLLESIKYSPIMKVTFGNGRASQKSLINLFLLTEHSSQNLSVERLFSLSF